MNCGFSLGRGLLRLWIVLSTAWWVLLATLIYQDMKRPAASAPMEWILPLPVLFLLPFLIYGAVRALLWVIDGFQGGGR